MTYTERLLKDCTLCPRRCHANRLRGERGACGMTNEIRIARVALHPWEEPCISGEHGSGTVFFSGCPLQCVYCQNREIAAGRLGKPYTVQKLADAFLDLQEQHAHCCCRGRRRMPGRWWNICITPTGIGSGSV